MAGPGLADGPSYSYLQGGYVNFDVDNADADGDGFGIAGSAALTDMFFAFGSYDDGELDGPGGSDFDLNRFRLGAGVNFELTPTTDLVGSLYYVDYELDGPGPGDGDEDGFGITGGVRSMITPQLELNGGLRYEDLGGSIDDETALELGGVFSFTPAWAAYAGVSFSDDVTEFGIGGRYYFGGR